MTQRQIDFLDKLLVELKRCSMRIDEISKKRKKKFKKTDELLKEYRRRHEDEIYEPPEDEDEYKFSPKDEVSPEDEGYPEDEIPPEREIPPEDEISPEEETPPEDEISPEGEIPPEEPEEPGEQVQADTSDILNVAGEIVDIVSRNISIYADEGLISSDERDEFVKKTDELKNILDSAKEGDIDEGALKDFIKNLVDVVYKYIDITAVS